MDNDYKIKLEVRGRTCDFGADSVAELFYLFSKELFRLDTLTATASTLDKDKEAAKKLLDQYRGLFERNRKQTPIFREGTEIDLARCYLSRMTIEETTEWLKKERNFMTSKSAIGRYFSRFDKLSAAVR